ncbi:MAG: hypothetical protein EKK61_03700 [Rickettsiales bacterium]|nr:MAG: hypothetical protein EKK61_03700 [Rickettsiales bacterium]
MKKLSKGLRQDELPIDQPEGTWRDARNMLVLDKLQSITNEYGFDNITQFEEGAIDNYPINKNLIGVITMNIDRVLFFGTTNPNDSEIGIINSSQSYVPLIKDSILNFNQNYPIQGTFETKFNDNRIIAWTDNYNKPRILNIDCIPFRISLPSYNINPLDLDKAKAYLDIFTNWLLPTINEYSLEILDGQGNLLSGVYYPIISYELIDGTYTSWSETYNGIPIFTDGLESPTYIGGEKGGNATNKAININFTNLDINYKKLRIGYLYVKNGVTSAFYNASYTINSSNLNVVITGAEKTIVELDINEVLIPNVAYKKAKTITSLQRKLYIGNLEKEEDINLQLIANVATIKWVRDRKVNLNKKFKTDLNNGALLVEGSFHDGTMVFFNKSFKSGECYAFYLRGKLKNNGGYTKAFHIPGRVKVAGDDTILNPTATPSDLNDLDGGNPIPKFRIFNTNQAGNVMGFWENENEEYPLDPNNPLSIHPDFSNIPAISVANRKVRHHVFPDYNTLIDLTNQTPGQVLGQIERTIGTIGTASEQNNGSNGTTNGSGDYFLFYDGYAGIMTGLNLSVVGNRTRIDGFPSSGTVNLKFATVLNLFGAVVSPLVPGVNTGAKCEIYWTLFKNGTALHNFVAKYDANNGSYISSSFPSGTAVSGYPPPYTITQYEYLDTNISISSSDNLEIEYEVYYYDIHKKPFDIHDNSVMNGQFTGTSADNHHLDGAYEVHHNSLLTVTFTQADTTAKVMGIEVSNINIPSNIADKLDCLEILYAKRDNSNIRIVANDYIKEGRFHTFDLMTSKAPILGNYLKPLVRPVLATLATYQDTINNLVTYVAEPVKIEFITKKFYVGENTTIPTNNTNKADSIWIVGGHGQLTENYLNSTYPRTLFDICVYRKNVYRDFQNQKLIKCEGHIKVPTGGGLIAPFKMYGGDVYINGHGFVDATTSNPPTFFLPVESASNINLRNEDIALNKYYFPKYGNPTPSWYGYNKDFNAINDFNQSEIYYPSDNCTDGDVSIFRNRVAFSLTDGLESNYINWRIFKSNNYYETIKNKGQIWNLLGGDKILYIHLEHTLLIAQIKDSLASNSGEVFLGTSEVFDRPPVEILSINEGYAGTQSQFACILCKLGYCFIDQKAGKVFIYKQSQALEEISAKGLYNFFNTYGSQKILNIDNPFLSQGYTIAFDERYNRLIISKNVIEPEDYRFTLSYSPILNEGNGGWVSFHDYYPDFISGNRSNLLIFNNDNFKVYKHNSKTRKTKYTDETPRLSYIDVVFNEAPLETKRFDNFKWITVSELNNIISDKDTFTNIAIYNDNQFSGVIDLKDGGLFWHGKDVRNTEGTWNFNKFKDLLTNKTTLFKDDKNFFILLSIDHNKAWFNKNKFISKYIIVRLINNNINQRNLHLTLVGSNFIKSDR